MPSSEFGLERAWSNFYEEYGSAMLAWQMLESELATAFSLLSKISPPMAMQIFYSARSFNGRMDIFSASLVASDTSDDKKSFARLLIRKAKKYSEYRNKFAHDQPLLHQHGQPPQFEIVMVDGKAQFQSDELKQRYVEAAVTVSEIRAAADAFRRLATLVRDFWAQPTRRAALPDILREQLRALPSLPPTRDLPQAFKQP